MKISSDFFEAFLKCPTKCWLRFTSEPTAGNAYAEWVQAQNESYRADAAKQLMADVPANECVAVAPACGKSEDRQVASGGGCAGTQLSLVAAEVTWLNTSPPENSQQPPHVELLTN